MPMSSVEISQLIAQQQASQINANTYAQQISQSNPFQSLGQNQAPGGGFANQAGLAGTKAVLGAAGMGAAGLALAAEFGVAPRMFSSFATGAHMIGAGYSSAGMAGAIGMGGLAIGGSMAIGAAAQAATKQIILGAQQKAHMMGGISDAYGVSGMSMGPMNVGLAQQLSDVGMSMSDAAAGSRFSGMLNPVSMTNLIQQGMGAGQFRGVKSVQQFREKLSQMTSEAMKMAAAMNSTIEEASATLMQVQSELGGSGFNTMSSMIATSGVSGMDVNTQMQMAQQGAQMYTGMGMTRAQGSAFALGSTRRIGAASLSGVIDRNSLMDAGGVGGLHQSLTMGALRGFGSRYGTRMLAAMMDEDGGFNSEMAYRIASGTASRQEVLAAGQRRLDTMAERGTFRMNRNEVMGRFLNEYGAEGAISGLRNMFSNRSDGDSMVAGITGLSSRDLGLASDLQGGGGILSSRLRMAASQGLKDGMGRMSISQAVDKVIETALHPIRQRFQQVGRDIHGAISGVAEDIARDISGRPGAYTGGADLGSLGMSMAANAAMGQNSVNKFMFGDTNYETQLIQKEGFFGSMVPAGIRHMQSGGDLSSAGSFLPSSSDARTMGILGGMSGIGGVVGRGLVGGIGTMPSAYGAMGNIMKGFKYTGLLSMGGRGLVGGTLGAARLGMGVTGLALRLGSSVMTGPIGAALLMGDAISRAPGAMTDLGFRGVDGGIMGANADALIALNEAGMLNTSFMTGYEENREQAARYGLTSVQGLTRKRGVGYLGLGTTQQGFVSQRDIEEARANIRKYLGGGAVAGLADEIGIGATAFRNQEAAIMERYNDLYTSNMANVQGSVTSETRARVSREAMEQAMAGTDLGNYAMGLKNGRARSAFLEGIKSRHGAGDSRIANLDFSGKRITKDDVERIRSGMLGTFKRAGEGITHAERVAHGPKGTLLGTQSSLVQVGAGDDIMEDIFEKVSGRVADMSPSERAELLKSGKAVERMKGIVMGAARNGSENIYAQVVQDKAFETMVTDQLQMEANVVAHNADVARRDAYKEDVKRLRNFGGEGGVREYIQNIEVDGSGQIAEAVESYMQAVTEGDMKAIGSASESLRRLTAKLDPDSSERLARSLHTYAASSGTATMSEIASTVAGVSNFRARNKRAMSAHSKVRDRAAAAADMLGGGDAIKKALGLSKGGRSDYIRSYIKEHGSLPASSRISAEKAVAQALRERGMTGAEHTARNIFASGAIDEVLSGGTSDGLSEDVLDAIAVGDNIRGANAAASSNKADVHTRTFISNIETVNKGLEGLATKLSAIGKVGNAPEDNTKKSSKDDSSWWPF